MSENLYTSFFSLFFKVALRYQRKYNVENPFDWMEFISLQWVFRIMSLLKFVVLSVFEMVNFLLSSEFLDNVT